MRVNAPKYSVSCELTFTVRYRSRIIYCASVKVVFIKLTLNIVGLVNPTYELIY